jgi:hypothetical protein
MNRLDPVTAASEIITQRYEGAAVTFLAGSVMRGEGTDTSDLDLVVVYERIDAAFRESFTHAGWPVEAFVHDPETLRYFFLRTDRRSGVPSLAHMVSTGMPLPRATDFSRAQQALADEFLARGPVTWDDEQFRRSRYAITNLVDDLRSPRSRSELAATGAALYAALADHFLLGQGQWSASGKSIPRRLMSVAPAFAGRFNEAFELLFAESRTDAVIALCAEALAPSGGWLFDGYRAVAPADWRIGTEEEPPV